MAFVGHIVGDDGGRADDGVVADDDALQHRGTRADPHTFADNDRLAHRGGAVVRVTHMVERDHAMPDCSGVPSSRISIAPRIADEGLRRWAMASDYAGKTTGWGRGS